VALIVHHTKNGLTTALALALTLVASPAVADGLPATTIDRAAAPAAAPLLFVTLDADGAQLTSPTQAATVRELLSERGLTVDRADYVSAAPDDRLVDGELVVYRRAVPVTLAVGASRRTLRSAAGTVGEFLARTGRPLRNGERVIPSLDTALGAGDVVRIERSWTSHVTVPIAPQIKVRYTSRLPRGATSVLRGGRPGLRVETVRIDERPGGPERTEIASRTTRPARPQVVLRGTGGPMAAAGRLALGGIAGAARFAGAAIHVLATAYTASCYGCSGITASGVRAGHGVIAVDPSVIPLGTHLFIPGYGRAVAGDTGGAIVGHRIDLGFDGSHEALGFGSRMMTIYVVK